MSQFWHAHWAEGTFKPTALLNWQIPNWHPDFPCHGHCVTTKFLADKSGRILADVPKSKRSPWGNFKGTWELPLKIDRKLAWKLSAPPKYKQAAWEAHKIRHKRYCEKTSSTADRSADRNLKTAFPEESNKNIFGKKPIENFDLMEEHKQDEEIIEEQECKLREKTKCLCPPKSDSHPPVEVTPKPRRRKLCTVHQRLRV